jgi:catechol 2,3-dioxygenase-like lactoylglutathione lyase family enzyme
MTNAAKVIPEVSLRFSVETVGFTLLYERPEERFAFLDLDGARLMIEQVDGPGRRFSTGVLEHPFGRGMHLQIEVSEVDDMYERVRVANCEIVVPLEERWYRIEGSEAGNRQFVVADPDGYLLRFFRDLGTRL